MSITGGLSALWLCAALWLPPMAFADEGAVIDAPEEAPEVTIIRREDAVIEEYRIGGQLYMIKVTPRRGIPYYLVDTDGDGRLDQRRSELAEDMMIPSWTLFRW